MDIELLERAALNLCKRTTQVRLRQTPYGRIGQTIRNGNQVIPYIFNENKTNKFHVSLHLSCLAFTF